MTAKWLPLTVLQVPLALAHFGFSKHPPALGQLQPCGVLITLTTQFFPPTCHNACQLGILLYLLPGQLIVDNFLSFRFQREWCYLRYLRYVRWNGARNRHICLNSYLGKKQDQSWQKVGKGKLNSLLPDIYKFSGHAFPIRKKSVYVFALKLHRKCV